jgi:hypothetical protein
MKQPRLKQEISMSEHRTFRSIHLTSTVWFTVCVGYILVLSLRQAGARWWVVFTLAGHSTLLIFLLVSLYLLAIFRGTGSQKIEAEHPLTSTSYYKGFYVTAPFLGGLAGCIGAIDIDRVGQFLTLIALGTLGTTFLVWVILDPAMGFLETLLLPACRKHQAQRLAQAKAEREKKQKDRERLLAEVLAKGEMERRHWRQVLSPQAEKLAGLLAASGTDFKQAEREAVGIGLKAWQTGGLNCMRELHGMAIARLKQKDRNDKYIIDYISLWWEGIGTWRASSLDKTILTTQR